MYIIEPTTKGKVSTASAPRSSTMYKGATSFCFLFLEEKILTTEQSVEGMKVELINLQPKLIAKILSLILPHGKCGSFDHVVPHIDLRFAKMECNNY